MGWDRHKLLWDGTEKYVPWTTLTNCNEFVDNFVMKKAGRNLLTVYCVTFSFT